MDDDSLVKIAKSLSDPHRLHILRELAQAPRRGYTDLLACVPISQPSLSQHIKTLVEAELVDSCKEGRYLYLSLNPAKLNELERFLVSLKAH